MTSETSAHQAGSGPLPPADSFSLLFHNHPVPMWIYDVESLAFLEVNDAAVEKYGYTRKEFLSLTIKDIRPQEDVERLRAYVKQQRPPLEHAGLWRHRLKNGRVIDVEITSHTMEFNGLKGELVMAQDVTERRQGETSLLESEQRHRRFYESGMLGVLYWSMTGQIVEANDKFLEMVGYSRDDLEGGRIDWVNMTPPEYRHLDDIFLSELNTAGIMPKPFEKEYIRKDGTRMPIVISGDWLDEEHFNGLAFVLDISERKQAEDQTRSQLEELQRWQDAMLGREDRVQELKREVNELCRRAGENVRYPSEEAGPVDPEAGKLRS